MVLLERYYTYMYFGRVSAEYRFKKGKKREVERQTRSFVVGMSFFFNFFLFFIFFLQRLLNFFFYRVRGST